MTVHEWIVTCLGLALTIAAPLGWRKWQLDPLVSLFIFAAGISLVVSGHC